MSQRTVTIIALGLNCRLVVYMDALGVVSIPTLFAIWGLFVKIEYFLEGICKKSSKGSFKGTIRIP